jgi:flagellar hook-associated protein 2
MVNSTNSAGSRGAASIDVAAVVKELMSVENKPLEAINAKIKTNSLVISDLGLIKTKLTTFSSALSDFESSDSYNTTTSSSSNTSSVTATSSRGTQTGNYTVTVTTLASPQRYIYAGYTSADTKITIGNIFNLQIGSTTYSNSAIKSSIGSTPTITEIADYINSLGENISASVVEQNNTGSNQTYVLTIQSTESGTDNAITLGATSPLETYAATTEVATATFSALSSGETVILGGRTFTAGSSGTTAEEVAVAFATGTSAYGTVSGALTGWSVSRSGSVATFTATSSGPTTDLSASGTASSGVVVDTTISGAASGTATNHSSSATDAVFALNGATYTRSSNSISDVVDGLALELVGTGSAVVKVSKGTDSSETVIKSLITAYNDLMASYKSMTANSSNSDTPGSFANNPTMLSFINEIKTKIAKGVSYGTNYANSFSLTYAGIDMQLDGTLKFNSDSYQAAITDGLQSKLSQGVTVGLSTYGYEKAAVTFRALDEGKTLILNGLTFTAGSGGATASQVASAFANGTSGRSAGNVVSSTVSGGAIAGTVGNWDIGSYSTSGSSAVFTSISSGNMTDLSNSGTGSATITTTNDSLATFVTDYAGNNGYIASLVTNKTEMGYDLEDRQDQIENHLNSIQNNYINQYSALNALLFQLSSTSTSLASVLDSLNSNNN